MVVPAASFNTYQITNVRSGLCLVPKNDTIGTGVAIVQVTCSADLRQQWLNDKGQPFMSSAFDAPSDVDNKFSRSYCIGASGSNAILTTTGHCKETTFFGGVSEAYIKDKANSGICLTVSGNSSAQNAALVWSTCNNLTSQQFWNRG